MTTRVLIADSHARYRQALRSVLSTQSDLEIVGESDNGQDAVAVTVALQPTLVIVDVMIEGLDGLEVVRQIRALAPSVRLLAISAEDDATLAAAMNAAGVGGHALKDDTLDELLSAIRLVSSGKAHFSARAQQLGNPRGTPSEA